MAGIYLDFAIIKLQRNENREWEIVGQTTDLPGGCRPSRIRPIIVEREDSRIVAFADGWIDSKEQYAYVKWLFPVRVAKSEVSTLDDVVVQVD